MLTISKFDDHEFVAKFGFSTGYFERVRRISGSDYDSEEKCFYIPMQSYKQFKNEFKGEFVYKTERTEFPGETYEDYTKKYKLKYKYKLPKLKVIPYNYQRYGIQFMLNKLSSKGYTLNTDSVGLGNK